MQQTFGYARVSATDQNLATQVEDLTQAGCTRIFQEKVSGTRTQSPALDELLAAVRESDVVVVNRLARLGRNTVHTIQLVEEFNRRGVHFRALDLGIDSRTPAGKMIIGVFSSFNQYERENNRQKSLAGIELAKQQGKHLGRPTGRDAEKLSKVATALERGLSVAEIVTLTGISRASVKRYRQEIERQIS
ncbi:recombinase family protein [Hymenobacter monticola]|uniref:Recombinase family protein n=1 Tax=Hymenobacter monticola TaxID=1705399 RepID=A0ABY4BCG6_9BACT|nr:recombinase family protein [Hymenobacter monticola]UOE36828.1 recombinase family protein [Hymenobacter monticola]